MKATNLPIWAIAALMFLGGGWGKIAAQPFSDHRQVMFTERNLSGPRIGLTFVPGDSKIRESLDKKGIGQLISQFGWHWEHRISTGENGPAFLTEWILLVGGVEYGTFIPGTDIDIRNAVGKWI